MHRGWCLIVRAGQISPGAHSTHLNLVKILPPSPTVELKLSTADPFKKLNKCKTFKEEEQDSESACVPARFNCPLYCFRPRREGRAAV